MISLIKVTASVAKTETKPNDICHQTKRKGSYNEEIIVDEIGFIDIRNQCRVDSIYCIDPHPLFLLECNTQTERCGNISRRR
jgi:hypothetical protein